MLNNVVGVKVHYLFDGWYKQAIFELTMKSFRLFETEAEHNEAVIEECSVSYVIESDKVYTTPENGGEIPEEPEPAPRHPPVSGHEVRPRQGNRGGTQDDHPGTEAQGCILRSCADQNAYQKRKILRNDFRNLRYLIKYATNGQTLVGLA